MVFLTCGDTHSRARVYTGELFQDSFRTATSGRIVNMVVGNSFSSAAVNNEKLEKQWNAVFPAEQKTEEDCLLFLSRMSYISIAEYLLHRELVSPKIFKRRRIGGFLISD